MAGYSRLYVVGGEGGFGGSDGVNPIQLQILVGDADRQWFEPHYFDTSIKPLGSVRAIIPARPNDPNALLDACIAFFPAHFASCPSLTTMERSIGNAKRLDFNAGDGIPETWPKLRDEARPLYRKLNIWRADLVPERTETGDHVI